MNLETIKQILIACLALNYALMILWFLIFMLWHDGLYHLHRRWFDFERSQFDYGHYVLMGAYKLAIFFFNLVPLIAIWCIERSA